MLGRKYLPLLEQKGCKYTEEDIVFITEDEAKTLVWLETGNQNAGLQHIIAHHKRDFELAFGISESEIAIHLYNILTFGKLIDSKIARTGYGFERVYKYHDEIYTFVAMGSNGYIVTAFPSKGRRHIND